MIKQRLNYLSWPGNRSMLLLLLLSMLCLGVQAQVTVTIPVNNDNDNEQSEPYGASNAYHRTQALYKANEIGLSGNITTIGFFVNDINNPMASTPIVIKLKNTQNAAVSGMGYPDASADAITVYTGNILSSQLSANSWVTVTLPVPFTYAGYNLEVFVETNAGAPMNEDWDAKAFRWSDLSFNACQTWSGWSTPPGPDDYGYVQTSRPNARFTIATAPPMSYSTAKVSQIVSNTYPGAKKQAIVGIQVEMAGLTSPLSATSFALNTAGSGTTPGLIQNARVYYTGISPIFDTITPFGAAVANPNGAFTVNGTQVLDAGTNYFWVAYDVSPTATPGDSLDATCTQVTVAAVNHAPTTTAPTGNMMVGHLFDFEALTNEGFNALSFNTNPNEWQRGTPLDGPSAAFSGANCWGTNLNGDYSINSDYALTSPSFVCGSGPVSISYQQWYDFAYQWNSLDAITEYEINGSGSWSTLRTVNLNAGYYTNAWANVYNDIPASPGDTIRIRWHLTTQNWTDEAAGWYLDNFVVAGAEMYNQTYISSNTNQANTIAVKGDRKREVISVAVETKGTQNPLTLTALNFTTGSASTSILESARVYYTGESKSFDSTTQFGSAYASPNGPFVISGSQELAHGYNYFWLVYDIAPTATAGDSADATCTQITISASNYTPTETDPAGLLPIARLYDFDTIGTQSFTAVSLGARPNEWQKGVPTYGPNGSFSGTQCWGTNLSGDYSVSSDYVFTTPAYVAGSDMVSLSYRQWFDFNWTWAGINAEFEYQVNNSGNWSDLAYVDNGMFANSGNNWENIFTQAFVTPGDTVQFRWHFTSSQWASQAPGWYIDNFAIAGVTTFGQMYVSSTSRGVITAAAAGTENQPVAAISIEMSGTDNALPLTAIEFNTTGTGTVASIKKARVFYTEGSKDFSTATQFGSDVVAPSGTFTVTGTQALAAGTNYFWLAYDIDSNATINDSLDAEITQLTIAAVNQVPDITVPEGAVSVGRLYDFDTASNQGFVALSQNQNVNQWERGVPTYGPNGAFSGTSCWATNLSGDINRNSDYMVQTPQYVISSSTVNVSFKQWFEFFYTFSGIDAEFQYEVNNGGWNFAYSINNNMVANSDNKWENIENSFSGMNIGDTIRFRWHFTSNQWAPQAPGWYIDNFIVSGVEKFNQTYLTSGGRQVGEATIAGTRNQAVMSIAIETSGTENPLSITNFNLGTTGSGNIVTAARLFYTGANNVFDTTVQYGTTVPVPGATFAISGNMELAAGTNYFWLAYDVDGGALAGDSIDGECTQITISSNNYTPTDGAPMGNVPVGTLYHFDTTSVQDFLTSSLNQGVNQWEKGVPTYGPSSAFSGTQCWGTNLSGDYNRGADYVLSTPPYVAQSDISYVSYRQWFDFAYTWSGAYADFQYNINNGGWSTAITIDNGMRENSNDQWENAGTMISTTPGDTIQFRWHFNTDMWAAQGPGWYVDNFLVSGVKVFDQIYKESYAEQLPGVTYSGAVDHPVLRVAVEAAGSANPLDATAFNFTTASSVAGRVKAAKLYYTGTTATFNTSEQFGTTVLTPSASFNVTGTQTLTPGTNYFWLAYDIDPSAVDGDSVDATYTQMTIGLSGTHTPTVTDPAGILPVGRLHNFDVSKEDFSTVSFNTKPSEWEHGTPAPGSGGPATAYSGANCWGTNLTGDFAIKSDYALVSPPFVARGSEMNLSFKQWFEFIYTSWNKEATFQYQVNNSGVWNTLYYIDLQNVSSSNNEWLSEDIQMLVNPGDTFQFRWRLYTGTWDPAPGWYIDNFLISGVDAMDVLPPSIVYTPIAHIGNNANRTLTSFAAINDLAGVDVLSGTKPRIYYKKKSEDNAFLGNTSASNGWKYAEATNSTSPFSFVIDYSLLTSGVVLNDSIEYFVTAQDINTPANVGANPSAGFDATSVNAIVAAPTTPAYYIITAPPMSGNYNVGTAQVYATLSAAVNDVNLRGVSGPVTLTLTNASYSLVTGETFPITFYPVVGSSATNTITVKPAAATTVSFSSNNAVFKIQGADNIIIDGSNNGTTSRDLSIQSTGNTGMVWLSANSGTDGAEFNTIKNLNLRGDLSTKFGIYSGHKDYTSFGAGAQAPTSNNRIENNQITRTLYGICMVGASKAKRDMNNTITKNQLGTLTEPIVVGGIYTAYHQGDQVLENTVANISFNMINFYDPSGGIYLEEAKQALVKGNKISNWKSIAGDIRMTGIYVYGGEDGWDHFPLPTNNVIANNFVANGYSTSTTVWDIVGIGLYSGNGDKVYFNTVSFSGTPLATDGSVRAFVVGYENMQNLDVRNNIFQINATSAVSTIFTTYTVYNIDFQANNSISDYNVISCVAGGSAYRVLGEHNYNEYQTLADWRTATGTDAKSKSGLVTFASANDLHLAGTSIGDTANLLGFTITGFTTDIDGDARKLNAPYIGADENLSVPLPVNLLEFNGMARRNDVLLNWATASEFNNKGFAVERSSDSRSFTQIGFVNGKGNSNTVSSYNYTDKEAFAGSPVLYYRLKQVDKNGSIAYSRTIRVSSKDAAGDLASTVVYPNPFNKEVFVQIESADASSVQVMLTDLTGRAIMTNTFVTEKGLNTINVLGNNELEAGVYFLTIEANGQKQVQKLIKQ